MRQFIRRGTSVSQPIGDLPLWLSTLLRNRGVDTPEKALQRQQLAQTILAQAEDVAGRIVKRTALG